MKIITITLSPAFDLHCFCENFKPFLENLCEINSYDAGGKGINISRALTVNGIKNTAYTILGEENADSFLKALKSEDINCKYITAKGRIRENITLHTTSNPETRISFSGFSLDKTLFNRFEKLLLEENINDTVVTFTGRIPDGINKVIVKEFLLKIKDKGAKLVIDSKSFDTSDLIELKPYLIKPNDEEISLYSNIFVNDLNSALKAAKELKILCAENVIISLGDKGAVLCCDDGEFAAVPPKTDVKSTVGAGDSMIAGFIAALAKQYEYGEALRLSVAFGTAACTTIGTKPPTSDSIDKLFENTVLKKV